jgi:hypothetical protein
MGERTGYHSVMVSFVNTDWFAAQASDFVLQLFSLMPFDNSAFMAPDNMTMANFVISPEFFLAGGTENSEHVISFLNTTQDVSSVFAR